MCETEAKGKCRVESCVYEIKCGKCEREGRRRVYVGESGRSAWERGGEHMRAWRAKEEGSFLWKHEVNEHGEGQLGEGDIKMKVVNTPRKALQRQIEEAVRIEEEEECCLMNSKKGYGSNKIPRIKILMGEDVRGRREDMERERTKREEKEEKEREIKKRGENDVWERGDECVWQAQEEWEIWNTWREEERGAARTRGRVEGETREGWWGGGRWGRMYGEEEGGAGTIQRGEKRERGQSQSEQSDGEDSDGEDENGRGRQTKRVCWDGGRERGVGQ